MPDFKLFHLKPNGEVHLPPEEFFATSDETAINYAARRCAPHGSEVWARDRFVAAIIRGPAGAPPVRSRREEPEEGLRP